MSNIRIGQEAEALLRKKFIEIEHLSAAEAEYGKFGFTNKRVNSDWHTFISGAVSMLRIQHEIVQK